MPNFASAICSSHTATDIIYIVVQIALVVSFLVLFYFLYVTKVEQDEFRKQINLLATSFTKDFNASDFVNVVTDSEVTKEDLTVILYGIIDAAQEKVRMDSKSSIDSINASNSKLRKMSYWIVGILAGLILILGLSAFCVPIYKIYKEAAIIVLFVGLTEFLFLTVISKNYISADPKNINKAVGQAVLDWLDKNKKSA